MAKNRPVKKDNNKEKKGKKEKGVGKRMKKEAMIALLQQQNSFLQQQLQEANRKADALLVEITSLRSLLECKSEEGTKQKRVIKGLAKNAQNKSENSSQ